MSANLAFTLPPAMSAPQFPERQRAYLDALFEFNPANLPHRVLVAESVLRNRLRAIVLQEHDQNAKTERQKIETALSNLRWLMLVLG